MTNNTQKAVADCILCYHSCGTVMTIEDGTQNGRAFSVLRIITGNINNTGG